MEIKKIFVVGAGTMGNGIAQTASVSGYQVTMMDVDDDALALGKATIEKSVTKLFEKERITAEQRDAAHDVVPTTSMEGIAEADFVIEAATENPELKFDIFMKMDAVAKSGVILSSNTSSISLTKLAAATERPEKVVGMHFLIPYR